MRQSGCQLGVGIINSMHNTSKIQYKPKVQNAEENKQRPLKAYRSEQLLKRQMWFEQRSKNTCQKETLWGKNVLEILGRNQGSSSKQ